MPDDWTTPRHFTSDDCDHDPVMQLTICMGGNGDWYVGVGPVGHKIVPTVRIRTSGGASSSTPGLGLAISKAYQAMKEESDAR